MVKIEELQNLVEKLDIDEVLKFNLRQFIDFGTTSGSEFLKIKKSKNLMFQVLNKFKIISQG
jgi:hypothetical protein